MDRVGDEGWGVGRAHPALHFTSRPARPRQLAHALVDRKFDAFDRGTIPADLLLVTMTRFEAGLATEVVFESPEVRNTLAETVARAGLRQFHLAETEKYAHVTYFINGGREQPFSGEERLLIPSAKVATYDQVPEMSAGAITDAVVQRLKAAEDGLIVVNYANADMVGHTGKFDATVAAVEYLDNCLGRLEQACGAAGYFLALTADHGNAEVMVDPEDGRPLTSHTTSAVPLLLTGTRAAGLASGGGLRDVAPTFLAAMGLAVPSEMDGSDLRESLGD